MREAVGESYERFAHNGTSLSEFRRTNADMNIRWSKHHDSRVPLLGVAVSDERSRVTLRVLKAAKAVRGIDGYFIHCELRSRIRAAIANVRTASVIG